MPGSFPFMPQPNSEDNENQAEYAGEVQELPFADEALSPDQSVTGEGQLTPSPDLESSLPPEAQGETNGGPLGCCLGVTVGIMLSLLLGVIGLGPFLGNVLAFLIHSDIITNTRIATAIFGLIGAVLGGYFGWKIGRRLYREYEPPVIKDGRRKPRARPKEAKL